MKKIFIITGEYSGDKHASDLVRAIKSKNSEIEIEAIGGDNLKATGIKLFTDHSKMSAVGLSFKVIFDHIMLGRQVVNYLKDTYKPDLIVMVDYGGFNLNLSKVLKKYGFKIFYYIPPQIWASRKWRLNTVKKNIDKVITIFPFEEKMYKDAGCNVEYAGHPLLNQLPPRTDRVSFFKEAGFDPQKKLLSIFPGSRKFEIKNLLALFLDSAEILKKEHPDLQLALCQAPTINDELISEELEKHKNLGIKVLKNKNYELLSTSDALMLASGTVALEAAIYNTPMIISYRGPQLFYYIYLLVRCIKRVCLPNIILDEDIVPELVQNKAKSTIIAQELSKFLVDEKYKTDFVNKLKHVVNLLSTGNSAENAAEIIIQNV